MSTGEPGRLPALPEDWQRALAIVAHPDESVARSAGTALGTRFASLFEVLVIRGG